MYKLNWAAQFRPKIPNDLQQDCFGTLQGKSCSSANWSLQRGWCRFKESPEIEHVKSPGPVLEHNDVFISLQPIRTQHRTTCTSRPYSVPVPYCPQYTLAITVVMVTSCGHSHMPPFRHLLVSLLPFRQSTNQWRQLHLNIGGHKYFVQMSSSSHPPQPKRSHFSIIYL